jgi:hypothetical protein
MTTSIEPDDDGAECKALNGVCTSIIDISSARRMSASSSSSSTAPLPPKPSLLAEKVVL